jgi:methylmalonyl-CoA/ethylmalonyl-CoA epimerase
MVLPLDLDTAMSRDLPPILTLHHIGVLVKNLSEATEVYSELQATISRPVVISSQGVRVCFADMGAGVAIELVEPAETGVSRDLSKRGITYYHLGYMVPDFDAALTDLTRLNYVHLQTFQSEAFEGRRCAFLMSPVLHLVEIIEQRSMRHLHAGGVA